MGETAWFTRYPPYLHSNKALLDSIMAQGYLSTDHII